MTSDLRQNPPREAYVWIWLPDRFEPVVAGRLAPAEQGLQFNYGKSYLERENAIPIYLPELPLQAGLLPLQTGLSMPGCLRDASPDAWGRRVIVNALLSGAGKDRNVATLDELTYLLESGSDRTGALDFQRSPTEYVPRTTAEAPLEELLEAAERVEKGLTLSPALNRALQHGTSIGGARPKALIEDAERKYVAKFSSNTDVYSVVKAEFVAMRLAERLALDVAPVRLVRAAGKDVLLVERFDRKKTPEGWRRRAMVSALTLLGLDETMARYASYEKLAETIRYRFEAPKATLHEMFSRMVFNILCGNTDDHARNHAAFWDGRSLRLTPAYDVCPQARTGNVASQAMLLHDNNRASRLDVCLAAAQQFLLAESEARAIIERQIAGIRKHWDEVCREAGLSDVDERLLRERQFLNPCALESFT